MFEWRLIIGSKQRKTNAWTVYAILKSLLSPLHKTQRSWMDIWMGDSSLDLYECIIYNEIIKWDPLLNPWVHYINSMWNPRVSWVWEFNSISFIVGLIKWRNEKGKKKKKNHFYGQVGVHLLKGGVHPLEGGLRTFVQ